MKLPGPEDIERAVEALKTGGVIAMPTDTLYGLCAAAENPSAVSRVFDVKGREAGKPLTLLVGDLAMAERIGRFDERSRRLARRFWPGQLTIVVETRPDFQSEALAGGRSVGLRAPDNAVALNVIGGFGQAVTGTSANLSGGPDPVSAEEVVRQIGDRLDLILDAGPAPFGVASTIVDCTGAEPVILREGSVSREAIDDALRE
jgi:L-threonylcarbamoyladenylate synthase